MKQKNRIKCIFRKAGTAVILLTLPITGFAQNTLSMESVEQRKEVSMANASGKSTDGVYRYYARGEEEPLPLKR